MFSTNFCHGAIKLSPHSKGTILEEKRKSFLSFVGDLVDEFSYEDFQPSDNAGKLQTRFKDVFYRETAFWKPMDLGPKFNVRWIGLELKTHKDWDIIFVGMQVTKKAVRLAIFNDLDGNIRNEESLPIAKMWLDHQSLVQFLASYLEKCLAHVNRENYEQQLALN